jgi:hypothetical protein
MGRRTTAPGLHFSFVGHQFALQVVVDQSVANAMSGFIVRHGRRSVYGFRR